MEIDTTETRSTEMKIRFELFNIKLNPVDRLEYFKF